jgi:hypothetical protein
VGKKCNMVLGTEKCEQSCEHIGVNPVALIRTVLFCIGL